MLQTDTSDSVLEVVLAQIQEGIERVIAFARLTLTEAERKYSVTQKECLALVWSVKKFWNYLEGFRFTVITDHSCLRWLHNLYNPNGRLVRWALDFLKYDFDVIYRKRNLR